MLSTIHYDICLYSAGCKEKIAVDKAVFWSTVSKVNLQESRILLSKKFTPSLTFLILFVILGQNSDNRYPQNFQTPLSAVWLLFFQPVRILRKLCLNLTSNSCCQTLLKTANTAMIKWKNSMIQKFVSKCLQETRFHRFKREVQKTDVYDQIKGRYNLVEENLNFVWKNDSRH